MLTKRLNVLELVVYFKFLEQSKRGFWPEIRNRKRMSYLFVVVHVPIISILWLTDLFAPDASLLSRRVSAKARRAGLSSMFDVIYVVAGETFRCLADLEKSLGKPLFGFGLYLQSYPALSTITLPSSTNILNPLFYFHYGQD